MCGHRDGSIHGMKTRERCHGIMDRAHEGNETQALVRNFGCTPAVPPNPRRFAPWEHDRELYKKRNENVLLSRRRKGLRRLAAKYDTRDVVLVAFIYFALIADALK